MAQPKLSAAAALGASDERLAVRIVAALRGAATMTALRALHLVTVAYLKSLWLAGSREEWEYVRRTWLLFVRDAPVPYVVKKGALLRVDRAGQEVTIEKGK